MGELDWFDLVEGGQDTLSIGRYNLVNTIGETGEILLKNLSITRI